MSQQESNASTKREEQVSQVIANASQLIEKEVNIAVKEYELLTELNHATADKYQNVAAHTNELLEQSKALAKQQQEFEHHFCQIDDLYVAAVGLQNTVGVLEKYMDDVEKQLDAR